MAAFSTKFLDAIMSSKNAIVSKAILSTTWYRGILVYNICLISISNSVSDGATNKSVLNIESS